LKITVEAGALHSRSCDVLFIPMIAKNLGLNSALKSLDKKTGGAISGLIKSKEFTADDKVDAFLYRQKGVKAKKIVLFSLGKQDDLSTVMLRKKAYKMNRVAAKLQAASCAIYLGAVKQKGSKAEDLCRIVAEGLHYGDYEFRGIRSEKKKSTNTSTFYLMVDSASDLRFGSGEVKRNSSIMEGVKLCRNLQNAPANIATPRFLAAAPLPRPPLPPPLLLLSDPPRVAEAQ